MFDKITKKLAEDACTHIPKELEIAFKKVIKETKEDLWIKNLLKNGERR